MFYKMRGESLLQKGLPKQGASHPQKGDGNHTVNSRCCAGKQVTKSPDQGKYTTPLTALQNTNHKNGTGNQLRGCAEDARLTQQHILHHGKQYQKQGVKRPFQQAFSLFFGEYQVV